MQGRCLSLQPTGFRTWGGADLFPSRPFTAHPNRRRCFQTVQSSSSSPATRSNGHTSRMMEPKEHDRLCHRGLLGDDLSKHKIGISSVRCAGNKHFLELSEALERSAEKIGMVVLRFNAVGGSDGISTVTGEMCECNALQSSDLIAGSIEMTMSSAQCVGHIFFAGCVESIPGMFMAMGRLNRPSIMVYGGNGTIKCSGEYVIGEISDEERMEVIHNLCPGTGVCGGMYIANIIASVVEAVGMSLPQSSSTSAEDPRKLLECQSAGIYLGRLLEMDLKPRDIITQKSLWNAMVVFKALGGSTDAESILIAIARSVDLELTRDDFRKVSDEVQVLADDIMDDLQKIGGTPAVIRYLLDLGYLDGDCMTVTGKTIAENAQNYPTLLDRQGNVAVSRGVRPEMHEMPTPESEIMGAALSKAILVVGYVRNVVLNSMKELLPKLVLNSVIGFVAIIVLRKLVTKFVTRFTIWVVAQAEKSKEWVVAQAEKSKEWMAEKLKEPLSKVFWILAILIGILLVIAILHVIYLFRNL